MSIRFIVATRYDETQFFEKSPLAESLQHLPSGHPITLEPTFQSSAGMAACYNAAIETSMAGDLLVFVHDDVYIDDWLAVTRLQEGLRAFDVIGVAGSRSRLPGQQSWWGLEQTLVGVRTLSADRSGMIRQARPGRRETWARKLDRYLSPPAHWRSFWQARSVGAGFERIWPSPVPGAAMSVRHGGSWSGRLDYYGPTPSPVKLLDGCLIAACADRVGPSSARFDPRFGYHLYDLDFCRQCEQAGLTMGTWPLAVSHASAGNFGEHWRSAAAMYLDKWGS